MTVKTIYLKLGGSLITDKTQAETVRPNVLTRLAEEIGRAYADNPDLRLVLGHGSGSFGHVAAAQHGTRQGVDGTAQWHGFTAVSYAATQLNQYVVAAMQGAGVPVISIRPSAIVQCSDGAITHVHTASIENALAARLIPLVMGDVAFDTVRGGTIVSTEEVMAALAGEIRPTTLLLAGETDGVYDTNGTVIPQLTRSNLAQHRAALGGSRGTDVTGGMLSKVAEMLALSQRLDGTSIHIISGLQPGLVGRAIDQAARLNSTEVPTLGTQLIAI